MSNNIYDGNGGNINGNDDVTRGPGRSRRKGAGGEQLPPYDPFKMRDKTNATTGIGALLHLIKSSLGSGILAMPNAYKNGGLIFGLFGTAVIGFLCTHCIYLLVVCSQTMARRSRRPSLGFADTAYEAFRLGPRRFRIWAPFARNFVNGTLFCTYYFGNCVYVILISASIKQVADAHLPPEWHLSIRIWILCLALPLLPLGIIRTLRLLVPFSAIATTCILVGLGCTMIWVIIGVSPFATPEAKAATVPLSDIGSLPWIAPVSHMPLFFTTVVFAMEGIGIVLPIENSMRNPQHFLRASPCGVLNAAMIIIVVLYSTVGFLGYLRFGDTVEGSITLNLPNDLFAETVKIMVSMSIIFSYGLQFCVPSEIAWTHVEPWLRKHRWISNKLAGDRKPSTLDLSTMADSTATATATTEVSAAGTGGNKAKLPDTVEEGTESVQSIDWTYYIMRSLMILITFLIAAIVPNLAPIISLFGAVFFSMLGLFCPAVIHLVAFWEYGDGDGGDIESSNSDDNARANRREIPSSLYTVFDDIDLDDHGNAQGQCRPIADNIGGSTDVAKGMSRFTMVKDVVIVFLAWVALVSGTYASMIDIINIYGFNSSNLTETLGTASMTSLTIDDRH